MPPEDLGASTTAGVRKSSPGVMSLIVMNLLPYQEGWSFAFVNTGGGDLIIRINNFKLGECGCFWISGGHKRVNE